MVHVYGFSFFQDEARAREYFVDRIGNAMRFPAFSDNDIKFFHNIRTVSPQSYMFGISFILPKEVAFFEDKQQIYDELEDKSRLKRIH